MRKVLLLLLGISLISILSYFCYMSKSESIKKNLLSKVETLYSSKGMNWVEIALEGENLKLTRTLILNGSAKTQVDKEKAEEIAQRVEGIVSIKNNIEISPIERNGTKRKLFKVQRPYLMNIRKFKSGKIVLSGYVPTIEIYNELLDKAKSIYGEESVIDKLQIADGAPDNLVTTISLGLDKLVHLDYGQIDIRDEQFLFEGYINSMEQSINMFKSLKEALPENYVDEYNIKAPEEEFQEENQKLNSSDTNSSEEIGCQKAFKEVLKKEKIHFSYNNAELKKSSYPILNNIANIIKSCPQSHIIIEGHTDTDGLRSYNQKLSEKRALAVKKYLVKEGIEEERLEAIGYGESKPLVNNSTKALKKQNRRIEFKVKGVE